MAEKKSISVKGRSFRMNETQLKKSTSLQGKTLTDGAWYRFRFTPGGNVTINGESGNMRLSQPMKPLDNGEPRNPSVYFGITLPYPTDPEDLVREFGPGSEELQVSNKSKGAPNTHFLVANFLRAIFGEDNFPETPTYDADAGGYVGGGVDGVLTKDQAEQLSYTLGDERDAFFSKLLADHDEPYNAEAMEEGNGTPSGIVGLELWGLVENNKGKNGKIYSNVDKVKFEPPKGATIGTFEE